MILRCTAAAVIIIAIISVSHQALAPSSALAPNIGASSALSSPPSTRTSSTSTASSVSISIVSSGATLDSPSTPPMSFDVPSLPSKSPTSSTSNSVSISILPNGATSTPPSAASTASSQTCAVQPNVAAAMQHFAAMNLFMHLQKDTYRLKKTFNATEEELRITNPMCVSGSSPRHIMLNRLVDRAFGDGDIFSWRMKYQNVRVQRMDSKLFSAKSNVHKWAVGQAIQEAGTCPIQASVMLLHHLINKSRFEQGLPPTYESINVLHLIRDFFDVEEWIRLMYEDGFVHFQELLAHIGINATQRRVKTIEELEKFLKKYGPGIVIIEVYSDFMDQSVHHHFGTPSGRFLNARHAMLVLQGWKGLGGGKRLFSLQNWYASKQYLIVDEDYLNGCNFYAVFVTSPQTHYKKEMRKYLQKGKLRISG